jgi:hypothetical protein
MVSCGKNPQPACATHVLKIAMNSIFHSRHLAWEIREHRDKGKLWSGFQIPHAAEKNPENTSAPVIQQESVILAVVCGGEPDIKELLARRNILKVSLFRNTTIPMVHAGTNPHPPEEIYSRNRKAVYHPAV